MEFTHSNGIHIPHFSASTINSFITSRYGFHKSKVKRAPFLGSVYTARGTSLEFCISQWLELGMEDAALVAMAKFNEECDKAQISKFDSQRSEVGDSIERMAPFVLETYQGICGDDKPTTQFKFETHLVGVTRPIIGYLDFYFQKKRVRDTKMVKQTPAYNKQDYILQGALYQHATQCPVTFDYFIDLKKPAYKAIDLTDDDFIFGLSYLTAAAKALEELESCENPTRVMELMAFPDLSAMFNNKRDIDEACEIWGITRR